MVEPMNNTVRELRAASGWSQAHLADLLKVSRQTINAIETGRYDPSLPLAFAISKLFSQPIEVIFTPDPEVS
jgi:putative transcriptional regulator